MSTAVTNCVKPKFTLDISGGAVTQKVLSGLTVYTIYPQLANFLYVYVRKNVEISWQ